MTTYTPYVLAVATEAASSLADTIGQSCHDDRFGMKQARNVARLLLDAQEMTSDRMIDVVNNHIIPDALYSVVNSGIQQSRENAQRMRVIFNNAAKGFESELPRGCKVRLTFTFRRAKGDEQQTSVYGKQVWTTDGAPAVLNAQYSIERADDKVDPSLTFQGPNEAGAEVEAIRAAYDAKLTALDHAGHRDQMTNERVQQISNQATMTEKRRQADQRTRLARKIWALRARAQFVKRDREMAGVHTA
jgi:hypothetical protein